MTSTATKGASVTSSVINTVNTIIGSGLLVLPYAFRTDSIVLGTTILLLAAITNAFGLFLQGISSKFLKEKNATFFTVCSITYPHLSVLFDLAIALQCFGVNISYVVLTGDLLPLVLPIPNMTLGQMRSTYILLSAFITVPLCFLKRLDSLKYASVIALSAIGYLILLVYGNFFYGLMNHFENIPIEKKGPISWFKPEGFKPVFKTLAIVVLAYTCPNQFSIISELEDPSLKRISKIISISSSVTTVLFLTVALTGYLTFGNAINGNIILMYDDTLVVRLGRALLILMVLLSYPLMFHPARISFNNIYYWLSQNIFTNQAYNSANDDSPILSPVTPTISDSPVPSPTPLTTTFVTDVSDTPLDESTPLLSHVHHSQNDQHHHQLHSSTSSHSLHSLTSTQTSLIESGVPFPEFRFRLLTVLMLIASYLSAFKLKSFELILSLVGSTGGVLISFILPGFYGYKLINTSDSDLIDSLVLHSPKDCSLKVFKSQSLKICSFALVCWGFVVMVICLYSTLAE